MNEIPVIIPMIGINKLPRPQPRQNPIKKKQSRRRNLPGNIQPTVFLRRGKIHGRTITAQPHACLHNDKPHAHSCLSCFSWPIHVVAGRAPCPPCSPWLQKNSRCVKAASQSPRSPPQTDTAPSAAPHHPTS